MQEDAPVTLLNVPAGHGVAEVLPVPLSKEPAGVIVQEVAPETLLKVPAEHGVAEVAPVALTKEPAGASVQAAAAPVLKEPGAQRVEEVAPGPAA